MTMKENKVTISFDVDVSDAVLLLALYEILMDVSSHDSVTLSENLSWLIDVLGDHVVDLVEFLEGQEKPIYSKNVRALYEANKD